MRLLGPVELYAAGARVGMSPLERTLVALLTLADGRAVSVARIVDALWGEAAPVSARGRVQVMVSGLRRTIGDALVTRAPGYVLDLRPGESDVSILQDRASAARVLAADGSFATAAGTLREGLAEVRGTPLGGLTSAALEVDRVRLSELVTAVIEERVEADLALGRGAELVPELVSLTAEHPLREALHRQLMIAFHQAGRQADAFAVYRALRSRLVEELGVEPTEALQQAHRTILANEIPVPMRADIDAGHRPAQLPPDIGDFTGHDKAIARIHDTLMASHGKRNPHAVNTVSVTGMGGLGKSTLAIHVGHRLREYFPDGQLYVNLRGTHDVPADPAEVLAQFLRALGVGEAAQPDSLEERAASYRSKLSGRRLFVLLDDALGEDQVRPLLPGEPGCVVLVTSRVGMPGLAGALHVPLTVLEPDKAYDLLAEIVGRERVAAEQDEAVRIVELCGGVPLALRIAGTRLAGRPHWRLAMLARMLGDERQRLDALQIGDLAVRASLELSHRGLDPPLRRVFRLLGLLAAPDFAAWAAAALLDVPIAVAEARLDLLVDARLVEVAGLDDAGQLRYRLHDLVRLYARERAEAEDPAGERELAIRRALGSWLALAREADRRSAGHLMPHRGARRQDTALEATVRQEMLQDPLLWFECERIALTAAVHQASASGLSELAWDLAGTQLAFHELRNYRDNWRDTQQTALSACVRDGNRRGEAMMLRNEAVRGCFGSLYRFEETIRHAERAAELFRAEGDPAGEIDAIVLTGLHLAALGRLEDAARCQLTALARSRASGYEVGEVHALHELGTVNRQRGDYERAVRYVERALQMTSAGRHGRLRAALLSELGIVRMELGEYAAAVECLEEALALVRAMECTDENFMLLQLGRAYVDSGHPAGRPLLERMLAASRNMEWAYGEAFSLCALGDHAIAAGDVQTALHRLTRARSIAEAIGMPLVLGRVLRSLGSALALTNDVQGALLRWEDASQLFAQAGATAYVASITALRQGLPPQARNARV